MADLRREVGRLLRQLESEHGCQVSMGKSGHWRVKRAGYVGITIAATPSDPKVMWMIRSDVRKYLGVEL